MGEIVWVNLTVSPLWVPGEEPDEFVHIGFVQDITERKRAEEKLKESELLFRTLFEHAAVGVALIDTKSGQYIDINQKYCDFVGYSKTEMLNSAFQDVTFPQDVAENVEKNRLLINGEIREFAIEKRYSRKDGKIVWGALTASPLWHRRNAISLFAYCHCAGYHRTEAG